MLSKFKNKWQRRSRPPNVRGQGLNKKKKIPRPTTRNDFSRTEPVEVNDMNNRGQGPRTRFFLKIMVDKFFNIFKRESVEDIAFR